MGWSNYLIFGEWGNRHDINQNEQKIRDMARRKRRQSSQQRTRDAAQDALIDDLIERCDRLELCVNALGRLLVDSGTLKEAEFSEVLDRMMAELPDAEPSE